MYSVPGYEDVDYSQFSGGGQAVPLEEYDLGGFDR
jgi:DNA-directed RNA polymerase subunit beta'